jgi:hypothetical protein
MAEVVNPPEVFEARPILTDADARVGEIDTLAEAPEFELPEDFVDEQAFLRYAIDTYNNDVLADEINTMAAIDDHRFVVGEQWDPTARQRRIDAKKPVITVNRLPAFIAQIMGNRLLNETVIKVIPEEGGTKEKARVRQGLIRAIEKASRAQLAYDTALQCSLIGGIGNFALDHDYAKYDVFYQDLMITRLPDPMCVVWDSASIDPSGRDAAHVFVAEDMSKKAFERAYPWAQASEFGSLARQDMLAASGWYQRDTVRIVKFYRMRHEKRTVILHNQSGKSVDVTDMDPAEWEQFVAVNPVTGQPYIRETNRPYCEIYKLSASNILEGPTRLNCSRVPVFRVPGWEVYIGQERHRWGMIRFAKDPQRIHNYWRSVIVEKLMQTPRAKWKATKEAVQGFEHNWRNSHLTDDPLLLWNGDSGQEPSEVSPAQIEPALIQEANMASQDIKDVLNMHEAALGQASNEVSGRALNARQRVAELGAVIYFTNQNNAIEECGRVINELIPDFYDTVRMVRQVGEDGKAYLQEINAPGGVDIREGSYGITVTTGPSYTTRRVEAVESMMSLSNANPEAMAPALDLMVSAMDWPDADAIAKRLKRANPIAADDIDPSELTPTEQQQFAAAQEQARLQAQLQQVQVELQIAEMQAKIALMQAQRAESEARTRQANSLAVKTLVDADKSIAQRQQIEVETGQIGLEQPADPMAPGALQEQALRIRRAEVDLQAAEDNRHINIAETLNALIPPPQAEGEATTTNPEQQV